MDRLRIFSSKSNLIVGVAEENKSMGAPRVGGPYSLIDHFGNPVTQDTYAGKHTLVSSKVYNELTIDIFRIYSMS